MQTSQNLPQKDETTKYCPSCKTVKPLNSDYFYRDRTKRSGFGTRCKECDRIRNQTEAVKKAKKAYAQSEKGRAYYKSYQKSWAKSEHRKSWLRVYNKSKKGVAIFRAKAANQNAEQVGAPGKLTGQDVFDVLEKYPLCLNCGTMDNLSIDHVVPLAAGGPNTPDNLQVLCVSCNSIKHTKTIDYRPNYNPSTEVRHDAPQ